MLQEILNGYMIAWFIGFGVFAVEALFVLGLNLLTKRVGLARLPIGLVQLFIDLGSSFLGASYKAMKCCYNKYHNPLLKVGISLFNVAWLIVFLPLICFVYCGCLIYTWVYRYITRNGERKNATVKN